MNIEVIQNKDWALKGKSDVRYSDHMSSNMENRHERESEQLHLA